MSSEMTPEESKRLHLDWCGQCRTCKHWNSPVDRPVTGGFPCVNKASPLYAQETTSDGYCEKWDSFDEPRKDEIKGASGE